MADGNKLKELADAFLGEALFVSEGLKARGGKYYARTFAICGGLVFFVFEFICRPPRAKLAKTQSLLLAAAATSKFAQTYQELSARLAGFQERLPPAGNAGPWLLDAVRDSMRAEGLSFTSLSPVSESKTGGFMVYSLTLTCRGSYKQIASWISRLERSRQALHVGGLSMTKDKDDIGMNQVEVTVSSFLPLQGGEQ